MIVIDFETLPIEPRPDYPPKPVAVSVLHDGRKKEFAYGMPDMRRLLGPIFRGREELLFHHAAFDLSVATEKLGLPMPPWQRVHDTMWLIFLHNPYAQLALKTAARELLHIGEEDQQELADWIYANIPEAKGKKLWGKWIGYAPKRLLEKRAHGDTFRTWALFQALMPEIKKLNMTDAYNRERRLLPMLMANSKRGVRVDVKAIRRKTEELEEGIVKCDNLARKMLRAPGLNVGSPQELIKAIDARGMGGNWLKTPGGKDSAAKNSLLQGVTNKELLSLLQYRGKAETGLSMFLRKWCDTLDRTGNRLYTDWKQVKGEGAGAMSGRMSSSPNFQNIPKGLKADDLTVSHGLTPMPLFRTYFLPEPGETWVRRDYSQQELRILAHFAGGNLKKMYLDNPKVDFHQFAADSMEKMGVKLMTQEVQIKVNRYDDARGIAKMIAFSILYGMGDNELGYRLGIDASQSKHVRRSYLTLFPGLKDLNDRLKSDKHAVTWGGRHYDVAPPMFIDGRIRSFEYKLLNYLIQGSAADYTKEGLCRLYEAGFSYQFRICVHDEDNFSLAGTVKQVKEQADAINEVMCSPALDVPMLSDGERGKSWGSLRKW